MHNFPLRITKETLLGALLINIFFVFPDFKPIFGLVSVVIKYITTIAIAVYCIYDFVNTDKNFIYKWLQIFLLYVWTVGIITPLAFWGQSLLQSFHALLSFGGWILFFFFYHQKYNLRVLEDTIIISSFIYAICYLYVFSFHYNEMLYLGADMSDTNSYRMFFGDYYISIFSFYILLNRYFRYYKKAYLFLLLIPMVVIIMIQTRQVLIVMIIIILIYLYRKISIKSFIPIFVGCAVVGFIISPIIEGLYQKTYTQQIEGKSTMAIRAREYYYYFNELNTSIAQDIIGNGIDQDGSYYNSYLRKHWPGPVADAGYAGIFSYWGILGLSFFFLLFIYIFNIKTPSKYEWLYLSVISMMLFNIASFALRSGIIVLPLYGYYLILRKNDQFKRLHTILNSNRVL